MTRHIHPQGNLLVYSKKGYCAKIRQEIEDYPAREEGRHYSVQGPTFHNIFRFYFPLTAFAPDKNPLLDEGTAKKINAQST